MLQVRGGGQIVLKGLYSGFAGNLAGVLPYVTASAIFIGVYEPKKQKLLKSWPENFNALAHLTAGSVGGAASSIIRVPTEVVTQRMQTEHFASAPVAVRLIVAKEGFKGLFAVAYNDFVADGSLSAVREKGLICGQGGGFGLRIVEVLEKGFRSEGVGARRRGCALVCLLEGSKNDSGCVLSFKHRNLHSRAQTLCENACKRVRTVRQWIESNAQQAVIE
ncbi:S-adenosylmethionine carrier 1, chloroplastic/mitochondrial-like protein isoform X2 [Tanacetum coccineum]